MADVDEIESRCSALGHPLDQPFLDAGMRRCYCGARRESMTESDPTSDSEHCDASSCSAQITRYGSEGQWCDDHITNDGMATPALVGHPASDLDYPTEGAQVSLTDDTGTLQATFVDGYWRLPDGSVARPFAPGGLECTRAWNRLFGKDALR